VCSASTGAVLANKMWRGLAPSGGCRGFVEAPRESRRQRRRVGSAVGATIEAPRGVGLCLVCLFNTVVKPVVQPGLTTGCTNSGCSFNTVVKPWSDNRLDVCLHDIAGCETGCITACIM